MARRYAVTINNWTDNDMNNLRALPYKYLLIGKEVGASNTNHLQIYIEFINPMRFNTLIKKLDKRAHIEICRGSQETNIKYCKKDNDFIEYGTPGEQGARKDLDEIRQHALDGGMRLVTQIGSNQQIKVAEKFLTYNEAPRDWQPKIIWIYGSSGCGKSRMARKILDDDVYVKNTPDQWFCGYDGHSSMILDDFRDSWMKITDFLSITDRYERRLQCKGGNRQIKTKTIVITTIKHPMFHYEHAADEPRDQILRRINIIINKDTTVSDLIEQWL